MWQHLSKMIRDIWTGIFNRGWKLRLRNNAADVFRLNFFSGTAFFSHLCFLKEVLAFQMQDVIFLEFNSTFSHACEIGVSCVSWSVVRGSTAPYVLIFALCDNADGHCFTLHLYQIISSLKQLQWNEAAADAPRSSGGFGESLWRWAVCQVREQ